MSGPIASRRAKLRLHHDCPWTGHVVDPALIIRNAAVPNMIGSRCVKCSCMVYHLVEQSQIVGVDGELLAKA